MKNKILVIFFAMALILPCLCFLSSCGNEQAKVKNIYVTIDDERKSDLGDFDYGSQIGLNNVKIIAVYSDNTESDITKDEALIVTFSCSNDDFISKPISELSNTPEVGSYRVTFQYDTFETSLHFLINHAQYSSGYRISLSKQYWAYDEVPATVSLVTYPEGEDNSIESYVLAKENYELYINIEDSDEKESFLFTNSIPFPTEIYGVVPGEYYAYARISETKNYASAISDFVKFTIYKGTLTKTDAANCSAFDFNYTGYIGDISLENINLKYQDPSTHFVDKNGEYVDGYYSWVNPETKVNCLNSKEKYSVQFIPFNNDCWEIASYGKVEITIEQAIYYVPYSIQNNYYEEDISYYPNMSQIKLFDEIDLDCVNITKSVNDGAFEECDTIKVIDGYMYDTSVNSPGKYTYKISLKDKINYCWKTDFPNDDLIYTYNVNKMYNNLSIGNKDDYWVLDPQGKVKLEIDTSSAYYFEDTLKATIITDLDEFGYKTTIDCTVEIATENEKTYLVITVNGFDSDDGYGRVNVEITANGKSNYMDIRTFSSIRICKYYSYDFLSTVYNEFITKSGLVDSNRKMYLPVGTKIMDVFKNYLSSNEYGEVKAEISTDGTNWNVITDSDEVTELYKVYTRFVFIPYNEICCDKTNSYEIFTSSDYSKAKQTLEKNTSFNYTQQDKGGVWLYFDLFGETRGSKGYTVTLTISNVSSDEMPVVFNLYSTFDAESIPNGASPIATKDNFAATSNLDEYSLSFNATTEYFLYIYVVFPENVDVNITYTVTSYNY